MEQSRASGTFSQATFIRLGLGVALIIASAALNLSTTTVAGTTYGRTIVTTPPRLTMGAFKQSAAVSSVWDQQGVRHTGLLPGVTWLQIIMALSSYLMWLAPAGAAYMLYRELTGFRSVRAERVAGIGALAALGFSLLSVALAHFLSRGYVETQLGLAAIIAPLCGAALLSLSGRTAA